MANARRDEGERNEPKSVADDKIVTNSIGESDDANEMHDNLHANKYTTGTKLFNRQNAAENAQSRVSKLTVDSSNPLLRSRVLGDRERYH
jgi:hypothetical protein